MRRARWWLSPAGQAPDLCPGSRDFTDAGHFIVITGYTGEGFTICDPNSPQRSAQVWTFARLKGQVKNVWAFFQKQKYNS